uniref:Uncharacterized protein n=1 Tax=Trichuris muris TaxID=70415 RepID=A0A5S6QIA8_TRIMR
MFNVRRSAYQGWYWIAMELLVMSNAIKDRYHPCCLARAMVTGRWHEQCRWKRWLKFAEGYNSSFPFGATVDVAPSRGFIFCAVGGFLNMLSDYGQLVLCYTR